MLGVNNLTLQVPNSPMHTLEGKYISVLNLYHLSILKLIFSVEHCYSTTYMYMYVHDYMNRVQIKD